MQATWWGDLITAELSQLYARVYGKWNYDRVFNHLSGEHRRKKASEVSELQTILLVRQLAKVEKDAHLWRNPGNKRASRPRVPKEQQATIAYKTRSPHPNNPSRPKRPIN
jgi:hypothetical protein